MGDAHGDHDVHVSSVKFNLIILGALISLTILTYVTATMELGFIDTPLALVIAFTKTTLVILYFMHVRWSSSYVKILSGTGFAFLIFLFGFTVADITTRTQEYPWSAPTWVGAAHRSGLIGDVPEAAPSVEGIVPGVEAHGHHGGAEHGHEAEHGHDEAKGGHGH